MITSVSIQSLRGIREGGLEGMTPLTVLVGPNSSGKSTILEALLIGASASMATAVGSAVMRRPGVQRGARWLLWRGGDQGGAAVTVRTSAGAGRVSKITNDGSTPTASTVLACQAHTSPGDTPPLGATEWVQFQPGNTFSAMPGGRVGPLPGVEEIRLVEPHGGPGATPLHDLYSRAVQRGRRAEVKSLLAALVPEIEAVDILTDEGEPVVHAVFKDHAVPAGLLGDGIQSLLRQSCELATKPGGVVLLEEPEVHEHPSAVWQTALAIVASVRRDAQVVLTTHSIELIDALLNHLRPDELGLLSLYRLTLEDGVLVTSRLDGAQVRFARGDIEDDLR